MDALNMSGTAAEGPLAIYPDWTFVDSGSDDLGQVVANRITTTIPDDANFPVTATARARNTCGDSTLVVTIEA